MIAYLRIKPNSFSPAIYFDKKYDTINDELLTTYSKQYVKTMCQLSAHNPLFITAPIPEMRLNVPNTMARRAAINGVLDEIKIKIEFYNKRNEFIFNLNNKVSQECSATILDTSKYLCDKKYCYGSLNGRPLYYDGDHLSEYGNKLLIPMFKNAMR